MSRAVLAGAAAVLVGALSSACAGVEQPSSGGKLSAAELEEFLVEAHPEGPTYDCKPATPGRWDYVCSFTDNAGARMNMDVMVNGEQATRSSGVYPAHPGTAAERTRAPDSTKRKWLAKVNRLCRWAKGETAQVGKPRTRGEYEQYVIALRAINERYRRKLAALPASPTVADRATFQTLLFHLKEDRRLATELLKAIRAANPPAATEFLGRLQLQAAEENRLLARMGACPAA
ncbi:MAG: hypothetical protein ACRDNA_01550 [Gaiellaceae bacterium]